MIIEEAIMEAKLKLFRKKAYNVGKRTVEESRQKIDVIKKIQTQRKRELLVYAFENIPLYHEKYTKCGINKNDLLEEKTWEYLPPLLKNEVKSRPECLLKKGDSLSNLAWSATGGSTGEPVKFYKDRCYLGSFLGWAFYNNININKATPIGLVGRSIPDDTLMNWVRGRLFPPKHSYLDAKCLTTQKMQTFCEELNNLNDFIIYGYNGAICELADYISNLGILKKPSCVITTSAPLADFQRKRLESVFCTKVYNQYGCCEIPWLAMECLEQNGLHVMSSARVIDIVDSNNKPCGEGITGDILLTDLLEYRFPLIRYYVGDQAKKIGYQPCSCGCNFEKISSVAGRTTDCIYCDKGCVSGDYLTTLFDKYPLAVKSFQVIQKKNKNIILRIVSCGAEHDAEIEKVFSTLKDQIGKTPLSLERVESIPSDQGKNRFVINELLKQ